jgi:hypothetical protein
MQARITPGAVSPQVQRKCGCAAGGDCGCGGKKLVQRKPREAEHGDAFEAEADRVAEQLPPAGAQPLSWFEQVLGHDFSRVRIHDDAAAHAMADAEGARAFTHGSDVYFARGELARNDASRLIAHELAHTVQQGAASTVRRKPAVESCTPAQRLRLDVAQVRGASWVDLAIKRIDGYLGTPAPAADDPVAGALRAYFSTDPDYVRIVRDRLDNIRTGIRGGAGKSGVNCAPADEPQCATHPAFVGGDGMMFCQYTLAESADPKKMWSDDELATTLIHEAAHQFAQNLGGLGTARDRAYVSDRLFAALTAEERIDNAESYAIFVLELSGQRPATRFKAPPGDDIADCGDHAEDVTRAIARAERWNSAVADNLLEMDQARFESTYGSFFAAPRPPVGSVRAVFDGIKKTLREKLSLTCVANDPHCAGNIAFFWRPGGPTKRLLVCPAYLKVPEEQKVYDTYRMLLQYTRMLTGPEAKPYLDIVRQVSVPNAAPSLPIEDRTPRVLPSDAADYNRVLALARAASAALDESDGAAVQALVRELEANLAGKKMIIRFTAPAGELPRYSSLTNVLQLPASGVSDAELLLSLFRETRRLRDAGLDERSESEVTTADTARAAERSMVSIHQQLVAVLVRAKLTANAAAGTAAYRKGAAREIADIAATQQTTIFPILVGAAGEASLSDGEDQVDLGTLAPKLHDRAAVEAALRTAVLARAGKQIAAATKAGSKVLRFRIYQYGRKAGEFEVVP